MTKWFDQNKINIYWSHVSTNVDFMKKEDYFKKEFQLHEHMDLITPGVSFQRHTKLRINSVEMHDNVLNPFDQASDERQFLNVQSS